MPHKRKLTGWPDDATTRLEDDGEWPRSTAMTLRAQLPIITAIALAGCASVPATQAPVGSQSAMTATVEPDRMAVAEQAVPRSEPDDQAIADLFPTHSGTPDAATSDIPADGATPPAEPEPEPEPGPEPEQATNAFIWVVTTSRAQPNDNALSQDVALIVRDASGERRFALGKGTGAMMTYQQNVCHAALPPDQRVYPLEPGELAKISFNYAGADIFAVKQTSEQTFDVRRFVDGHMTCDDVDPCTLPSELRARFVARFTAPPREAIRIVHEGEISAYRCTLD